MSFASNMRRASGDGPLNYLPTAAEQEWLLESLSTLVRRRGYEQFLVQPIVEPNPRFFPEPRGASLYVLDRASRRLMQYAGLGDLAPEFQFFSQSLRQLGGRQKQTKCPSAAAMFLGTESGRCHFAINVQQSGDAEHLVGVMSHEIAHAYRAHHGLDAAHSDDEELLTDVTTVYLGFGVLSTNNSFRYRSSLELQGARTRTSMQASTSGYLPPQSFSFLLAAQLAARRASFWTRRGILKHLEPDQAAYARAALRHLRQDETTLSDRLRLPPPDTWNTPRPLEDMLTPLPEYQDPGPPRTSGPV